jgi:uncharacterized membrane protein YgaE (UPF0421/DUF939 family)
MIKLHFWQMAVARITALLIGVVVGAYWHEIFTEHLVTLALVGVVGSLYVLFVVFKQYQKK